jgi:TonB family protein
MFAAFNSRTSQRQRRFLSASLLTHGLLLAWLLHSPTPILLTPSSIALGQNGRSLSRIYWPSATPDDSTASSAKNATEIYRHQRLGHQKLVLRKSSTLAKLPMPQTSLAPSGAEDSAKTATLSNQGHGTPAGASYGTLNRGAVFGDEIRPALPVVTADPVAYPWELPDAAGNVVVEITIDERGDIVRKTVLQSLGPKIDEKVLAALDQWRFNPATRNGVAIASKAGCYLPFPGARVTVLNPLHYSRQACHRFCGPKSLP